jgi:putative aldouronate transport system substrate-binding protein
MKKNIMALLLASAIVISGLAGCSSSQTNASAAAETNAASTAEAPATDVAAEAPVAADSAATKTALGEYSEANPYHLVFAYSEFYQQDEAARSAVVKALNDYMRPAYHMEVEFLPLDYASYQSTLQLMFSGGDALDVMPIFYTNASSWISMGGVYDMAPLMNTADGAKIISALGEQNAFVGQMNGVLFGFPANKESVELGGLAMRADVCDELGITQEYNLEKNKDEYDGTYYSWDEAAKIFDKVKAAKPNMVPLYLSGSQSQIARWVFLDELVDSFGALDWEADHNTTSVVNKFETDTYKGYVKRMADWFDKGYIFKDAANDTQGTATMMKGGNLFSYASAIKPGFLAEANSANGFDCYAMYFGEHKEGGISTTNVSFFDTGIATNSKDPEMAFKFVSALYSDPVVENYWQNGIKDVNYQVLPDGTAYFVNGEDGTNYKYHQNTGWYLGNQFISYVWNDGSKTPDYWEKLQHHNDWASYPPSFGFMWDSTDYATELTALNNALNTYRAALETGSVGSANVDSTLKALNDQLYASGLDTVMKAKQEQLDKWLAAKK